MTTTRGATTRCRVAFTGEAVRWTAIWMHPFNDFMAPEVLDQIKARSERAA